MHGNRNGDGEKGGEGVSGNRGKEVGHLGAAETTNGFEGGAGWQSEEQGRSFMTVGEA